MPTPVVQAASFDSGTGQFAVPARTTAVFVSREFPVAPSTLDFVGLMYPRGGVASRIEQDAFGPSGFDVFVQVWSAIIVLPRHEWVSSPRATHRTRTTAPDAGPLRSDNRHG
jgi:hypothetical protein